MIEPPEGRRLRAALAAVLVRDSAPELRLMHAWLDSWSCIGLVVVGVSHQGFTVSLGEHGAGQWIAVFYHGRGGHEPVVAAGTAQEPTPWQAVQRAAWDVLSKDEVRLLLPAIARRRAAARPSPAPSAGQRP